MVCAYKAGFDERSLSNFLSVGKFFTPYCCNKASSSCSACLCCDAAICPVTIPLVMLTVVEAITLLFLMAALPILVAVSPTSLQVMFFALSTKSPQEILAAKLEKVSLKPCSAIFPAKPVTALAPCSAKASAPKPTETAVKTPEATKPTASFLFSLERKYCP